MKLQGDWYRNGRIVLGVALVGAFGGFAAPTSGDVSVGHHTHPAPRKLAHQPEKAIVLPTDQLRLAAEPFTARVDLGAFDVSTLLAEDAAAGFGPIRLGAARNVSVGEGQGQWQRIPGEGWLWTVVVRSPDAIAMRVELDNIDVPDGGMLFIRDASGVGQFVGPIDRRGYNGTGFMVTGELVGDEVLVEYFVPGDTPQVPALPFDISNVYHVYNPAFLGDVLNLREGPCHLDVTCYPAWSPQKQSVARITYVSGGFIFFCSGALINTTSSDETPYFMTANHCINTESEANSMQAYWFFQSGVCNGGPQAGLTSTNATIIAESDQNNGADQTLVLIRGALHFGVSWMGWTSSFIPTLVSCTNIHHPDGAYKRISFGTTIFHPFGDNQDFVGITWSGGTIEGGSSGSPCFRDSDGLFFSVASHSAVPLNCSNPDGPSGYGRFARFYPSITSQMAGSPDDALEPNNDCNDASADPGTGSFNDQIVKSTAEDWIAFDLDGCERLTVTVSFLHAWGDVDLQLFDGCGGTLVDSSTGALPNETVQVDNFGGPATYYLRIYLDGADTHQEYDMTVTKTSLGTAPSISDHPDTQTVDEGDPVSFSVTAGGSPTLMYQWKKDGGDLVGENGATLNIASADSSDAGDYTVVVSNNCDSVESNVATLTVESGLTADFDGDGDVDGTDFGIFGQCFGGSFNPPAATCPPGVDADLDGDGDVDAADFALFGQQFTGSM